MRRISALLAVSISLGCGGAGLQDGAPGADSGPPDAAAPADGPPAIARGCIEVDLPASCDLTGEWFVRPVGFEEEPTQGGLEGCDLGAALKEGRFNVTYHMGLLCARDWVPAETLEVDAAGCSVSVKFSQQTSGPESWTSTWGYTVGRGSASGATTFSQSGFFGCRAHGEGQVARGAQPPLEVAARRLCMASDGAGEPPGTHQLVFDAFQDGGSGVDREPCRQALTARPLPSYAISYVSPLRCIVADSTRLSASHDVERPSTTPGFVERFTFGRQVNEPATVTVEVVALAAADATCSMSALVRHE